MADKLVKWKPGKTGFYGSHTMTKEDWEGLGFKGAEDTAPVEFSKANNFTVVGDDLPFVQMDFFEEDSDYSVRKAPQRSSGSSEGSEDSSETGDSDKEE